MSLVYTGIGSRSTPVDVMDIILDWSSALSNCGYTLRSGGADGADTAFEKGARKKEIFLPWKGFNDNTSSLYEVCDEAMKMAAELHPAWDKLSAGAKKLQARNCYQILGADLKTPSSFVLCWTPDGCEKSSERTSKTGGTGQAIDLADRHGIPVFNFQREGAISRAVKFVSTQIRENK